MGLLDALFDQNTYGGQGGGLLDFLRTSQMQQQNYQPSAGFPQEAPPASFADRFGAAPNAPPAFAPSGRQFDSASFDPATYAPNQAQPINVGGYQMPRMGSADQFTPAMNAQAQIPPNAQPTQGQLPQAPQQAPQAQQDQALPSFLNNGGGIGAGLRGFVNNLHTGPIGALMGGVGSAAGMQNPAQQNMRAQYDSLRSALIQNGETPQAAASKAMVAVMNPEAAKTILPELFTNKQKWGVISKDPLEGEKYGWINDREQTINGKPTTAESAPAGGPTGMGPLQAAKEAGVTGEALYQYVTPALRDKVRAMIEGRSPAPVGAALRNPVTLQLISAAHAIDPTFDETTWKSRNEAGPDWSKGKSSEMVRAANQTLGHVDTLMNSMDALKNRAIPAWNAVANTVSENLGTGEQGAFRTNAHAVAEEMSKVFKGANLSDSEIRHWEQNLSENMSPTQQRAQIAILSKLLHGSLDALEKKRTDALGPAAAAKAPPIIGEEGQKVLKRVDDWVNGNTAPTRSGGIQEGATATNPQTGAKITFRGGKWQ